MINVAAINSEAINGQIAVTIQATRLLQANGSINSSAINSETINSAFKLVARDYVNGQAINLSAINGRFAVLSQAAEALKVKGINSAAININAINGRVAYTKPPRPLAVDAIGGAVINYLATKTAATTAIRAGSGAISSIIFPAAEPFQVSEGYTVSITDGVTTINPPLKSFSLTSSFNGTADVQSTTPRYIIGISYVVRSNPQQFTYATHDITTYNVVDDSVTISIPFDTATAAWLASVGTLTATIRKTITMSDGSKSYSQLTAVTVNKTTLSIGNTAQTITLAGSGSFYHPTIYDVRYQVDYDVYQSKGRYGDIVIHIYNPHIINYTDTTPAQPIKCTSYTLNGSTIKCNSIAQAPAVGATVIVDGKTLFVESIRHSLSDSTSYTNFTGTIQ